MSLLGSTMNGAITQACVISREVHLSQQVEQCLFLKILPPSPLCVVKYTNLISMLYSYLSIHQSRSVSVPNCHVYIFCSSLKQ